MLSKIIHASIHNKLVVIVGVILLIAAGIYHITKLPIDALPDITSNQVQVITISPALAAPEVERLVTFPVEAACASIPGIRQMRSISRFGLSVITIVFDDQTDMYWSRQQVTERLTYVRDQIPKDAGMPELAPLTTGLGEVYQYVLKPKNGYEGEYSLADLRTLQDWVVRRQLLGTKGVADVSSFGGHLKQFEVAVVLEKLSSVQLTIAEVYVALEANNQNSGGAYIERGQEMLFIRTEGLVKSLDDIRKIVVKTTTGGVPLTIGDIAEVNESHAIRYGALVYEDYGEVAGGVVLMLKGANGNAVVAAVSEKIEKIKRTLPEGVMLETFYDRSKMVDRSIHTVKNNLLEGALIVVLVLVIFLGNFRAGLLVASVIPLAMLFAIIMMNLFGVSGNLMSLGALDFGLIVDGAVIIIEAVLHRLHSGLLPTQNGRLQASAMDHEVGRAAGKMMNAAVFGQVIILIVYLPILALVGIEGKMFAPMAQTVSFALVGAFLLSLTYVPMMASLFLSKKVKHSPNWSDKAMHQLEKWYRGGLNKTIQKPLMVLPPVLLAFMGAVWLLSRMGGEFIPELEEGDFAVDTRLLTGSSLTESVEAAKKGAHLLKSRFPEIEKIVSRIGSSEIPTDPMPVEMGDMIILLKPKATWTSATSYDDLAYKMSATLAEIPGLKAGFQFPVQMRFNELISGARQDVVCKIFGEDLDTLAYYAQKMAEVVKKVFGATDLYVESVTGLPQIVVNYNRAAIARHQVAIADINTLLRTAFAGLSAGWVYENERRFDLVLRLKAGNRADLEDVKQLLVPTPSGNQIPLSLLASVEIKEGFNQIQREDAKRRIIVAFNVRGRDVESVVTELQKKAISSIRLPPGYYTNYGGAFENLQTAKARLSIAVPAALLMILLLLFFAFRSTKQALLIFTAIPLSAIGGVLGLWARGLPFSISAGVGFIALFGVAVLNGIVMITEFNRRRLEAHESLNQVILAGASSRLRPVLMTALVASLGFLPMALSQQAGAEVQRPLATVVIGGLISATLLTLFVLPILYYWMEKKRAPLKWSQTFPIIFLLLMPTLHFAQPTTITLKQALNKVDTTAPAVAVAQLQAQYAAIMVGSAKEMPKTLAEMELGSFNSALFDHRFSVSQTFSPIGQHRRNAALLQSLVVESQKEVALKRQEAKWLVRQLYNENNYLLTKAGQLQKLDSFYQKLDRLAALRKKTGETDALESALMAQQWGLVQQEQLVVNGRQQQITGLLDNLLQLQGQFKLDTAELVLPFVTIALFDSSLLQQHPLYQWQVAMVQTAKQQANVEAGKLQPEFSVGYNNMSLSGWQTNKAGVDRFYPSSYRFSSVYAGLHFSLFAKPQKAKIAAANIKVKMMEKEANNAMRQLTNNYMQLEISLKNLQEQLGIYKQKLLPAATLLLRTASLQLEKGEINYLQWLSFVRPSIDTQSQYFAVKRLYIDAFNEMHYLLSID